MNKVIKTQIRFHVTTVLLCFHISTQYRQLVFAHTMCLRQPNYCEIRDDGSDSTAVKNFICSLSKIAKQDVAAFMNSKLTSTFDGEPWTTDSL